MSITVTLNSGHSIPILGFGTGTKWYAGSQGENALTEAIISALNAGFRHIDDAEMYDNEIATGKGIKTWLASSGVPRSELFITSKVLGGIEKEGGVLAACKRTLGNLQVDYLDLYLLHAPFSYPSGEPFSKSLPVLWKDMEALVNSGLVKSIGVSNFRRCDIATVVAGANIIPAVNQVERHPCLTQENLLYECSSAGIQIAAYGPLCPLTKDNVKATGVKIAAQAICDLRSDGVTTPAQVLLAWSIQAGVITLTTTSNLERMKDALRASQLQLTEEEVETLEEAGLPDQPQRFFGWSSCINWDL